MTASAPTVLDTLLSLSHTITARKPDAGGDPETSYVARLLSRAPDAVLKKIGEEATEVVMAGKDGDAASIIYEMADLWFHCLIALAHFNLSPVDVVQELERRAGTSGINEKAMRKLNQRLQEEASPAP